jgi:hypothetical protein
MRKNLTGRRLTAYLAAGALSVTLAGTLALSVAVGVPGGVVRAQTPACVEEDSPGPCFWDADVRGNGIGLSFTVDAQQVVHYDTTGAGWQPVSQELGDALAEGEDATAGTRAWESCMVHEGVVTVVACPDGLVVTS